MKLDFIWKTPSFFLFWWENCILSYENITTSAIYHSAITACQSCSIYRKFTVIAISTGVINISWLENGLANLHWDWALLHLILRTFFLRLHARLLIVCSLCYSLSQRTIVISHLACFPNIVRPYCLCCLLSTKQLDKRQTRFFKRKFVLTQDEILVCSQRQNCWGWDLRGRTFWCGHTAHSALLSLRCLAGPQLGKNDKRQFTCCW